VKPTVISAEALFEEHRPALRWEWIAGHAHPERRFDEAAVREGVEGGEQRQGEAPEAGQGEGGSPPRHPRPGAP